MANTVKAYKKQNGVIIIDCGVVLPGDERVQYALTDLGGVKLIGNLIETDFSQMEELYFDSFLQATVMNAINYQSNCHDINYHELIQLLVLVKEKAEDFD